MCDACLQPRFMHLRDRCLYGVSRFTPKHTLAVYDLSLVLATPYVGFYMDDGKSSVLTYRLIRVYYGDSIERALSRR